MSKTKKKSCGSMFSFAEFDFECQLVEGHTNPHEFTEFDGTTNFTVTWDKGSWERPVEGRGD